MQRLLSVALLGLLLVSTSSALACEKHINGHQNSSDTNTEASGK